MLSLVSISAPGYDKFLCGTARGRYVPNRQLSERWRNCSNFGWAIINSMR